MSKAMARWLVAAMVVVTLPTFAADCLNPNDPNICLYYQSKVHQLNTVGNVMGVEMKFVCKTGKHAGTGWDIFCRSPDNKCNVNEHDVGPNSGGLTQWHAYDHCTMDGAAPNWTPPKDASPKDKANSKDAKQPK